MKVLTERVWLLFKRNWLQTLTYWSVYFSFGLCVAFLGPTILDLRCQTKSSLDEITWVLFAQQLFVVVGTILGGFVKKTLKSSVVALFLSSFIISIMFALIPLCFNITLLVMVIAVAGIAMGFIETIGNRQLLCLYQKDSAAFLQALNFFVGLGALISPLVADPFLSDGNCIQGANWTVNSSTDLQHLRSSMGGHVAGLPNTSQYPLYTEGTVVTNVSYAFWIMAVINLPVPAVVFLLMYYENLLPCFSKSPHLLDKTSLAIMSPTEGSDQGHGNLFLCCRNSKLWNQPATFFILHALGAAIVFINEGIMGAYAGFVYTFAVSAPLEMEHSTASFLNSVFWGSFTVGNIIFSWMSCYYTTTRMLTFTMIGSIVVNCVLLIIYNSVVILFICTCLLGICISCVYPAMLAFTEDLLDYKGCSTTVLVTSSCLGEMTLQVLVGNAIYSTGTYSFLLCCAISSFIGFIMFVLNIYLGRNYRNLLSDLSKDIHMEEKPKREEITSEHP